jgi:AcrR family transcriptional regulator
VDLRDSRPVPQVTRRRPQLTPAVIRQAALALIDREGDTGLTFRALGAELGADPTAVYRHFRSKDDLLLSLADQLIGEALDAVPPGLDWRTTLRALGQEVYRAMLRHPRLAVLVSARTTQGLDEARGIERVLAALGDAGFASEDAVLIWRALGDTTLAWAGLSAAYLTLPPDTQDHDAQAWTTTYRQLPTDRYPHIAAARPYLSVQRDPFNDALELLLDGVAARQLATQPTDARQ